MRTLTVYAAQRQNDKSRLADRRGDTQSVAAVLHDALGVKLYRLVRGCLDRKLTTAAWPVWGASIAKLRDASTEVKQLSLFRSPRIYRDFTKWVAMAALLYDTLVLAVIVGRMFALSYKWSWFLAALTMGLDIFLVLFVILVVEACRDMEYPFGQDTLDMPGLSYVTSAALQSLMLCTTRPGDSTISTQHLQTVDFRTLLGLPKEGKGVDDEEDEEEEEEDDENEQDEDCDA